MSLLKSRHSLADHSADFAPFGMRQQQPPANAGPPAAPTHAISRSKQAITIGVLVGIAIVLGFLLKEKAYVWDEAVYLSTAETLTSPHPYYSEIEFRPPLLPVLLATAKWFVPLGVAGTALALSFFAVTVVLVYLFGVRLYGYLEGVAAAVTVLLSPFFLHWSSKVMTDIPATAFVLLSFYLLFRHVEGDPRFAGSWIPLLAGLSVAGAVLLRWNCALAAVYPLILLIGRQLKWRAALASAAGFFAGIAPYVVFSRFRFGSFIAPLHTALTIVEQGSEPVLDRLFYVRSAFQIAGGLTVAALVAYLIVLAIDWNPDWKRREMPLLLASVVFGVVLSVLSHKEARYLMPAIPVLFLFAGRGFALLRENWGVCVLLLIAPSGAVYTLSHLSYFGDRAPWTESLMSYSAQTKLAGEYLQKNSRSDTLVYSNHLWPVAAYFSKRATVPLWPRDERFYRSFPKNMKQDGYVIYDRGVEKQPSEEWLDSRSEFRKVAGFGDVLVYSYRYSGQGAITQQFIGLLNQAREQFDHGQFDRALETLSAITVPDDDVSDLRGWSNYRMGRMEDAAAEFYNGLRADPDNPRCLTGLGFAELRLGRVDSARSHFERALAEEPDKVDALTGYGLVLMRLNRKREAAATFRRILAQTPGDKDVQEYLKQAEAP